jgi:hypothetical protein
MIQPTEETASERVIAASHEGPNTSSDQESMTMSLSASWHRIGDARSANSSWISAPDACHSYLSFNSIYYFTICPLAMAYSFSFRVFVHVACALKLEAERRPCLCIYTDIASRICCLCLQVPKRLNNGIACAFFFFEPGLLIRHLNLMISLCVWLLTWWCIIRLRRGSRRVKRVFGYQSRMNLSRMRKFEDQNDRFRSSGTKLSQVRKFEDQDNRFRSSGTKLSFEW